MLASNRIWSFVVLQGGACRYNLPQRRSLRPEQPLWVALIESVAKQRSLWHAAEDYGDFAALVEFDFRRQILKWECDVPSAAPEPGPSTGVTADWTGAIASALGWVMGWQTFRPTFCRLLLAACVKQPTLIYQKNLARIQIAKAAKTIILPIKSHHAAVGNEQIAELIRIHEPRCSHFVGSGTKGNRPRRKDSNGDIHTGSKGIHGDSPC